MTDKEKIRAELIAKACIAYCKTCDTKECEEIGECDYNCSWVQKFRKQLKRELKDYHLPKESVSEDLEKTADNYASEYKQVGYDEDEILSVSDAFIDGANWQKRQIMKDSIEYSLYADGDFITIDHDFSKDGYKEDDKIKLIIIKEAEK